MIIHYLKNEVCKPSIKKYYSNQIGNHQSEIILLNTFANLLFWKTDFKCVFLFDIPIYLDHLFGMVKGCTYTVQ